MDDDLIIKLIKQDKSNFSLIYDKYFDNIYAYCLSRLNFNSADAEDIVSQVFFKALAKINTAVCDESNNFSVLPWLYAIARNSIIDEWKKRKKNTVYNDDYVENISDSREDSVNTDYVAEKIKGIISEFDEETADIVYRKIYNEESFNEISKSLNISLSKVKMRYYRCIEKVTKIIENKYIK